MKIVENLCWLYVQDYKNCNFRWACKNSQVPTCSMSSHGAFMNRGLLSLHAKHQASYIRQQVPSMCGLKPNRPKLASAVVILELSPGIQGCLPTLPSALHRQRTSHTDLEPRQGEPTQTNRGYYTTRVHEGLLNAPLGTTGAYPALLGCPGSSIEGSFETLDHALDYKFCS